MNVYRSKIGQELSIPLAAFFLGATALTLYYREWLTALIMLATAAFVFHTFFTTRYHVDESTLTVVSGFLYKRKVPIGAITRIVKTKSWITAPAASLDRMEVRYNAGDTVILSPKNKTAFVDHLKKINPSIAVDLP